MSHRLNSIVSSQGNTWIVPFVYGSHTQCYLEELDIDPSAVLQFLAFQIRRDPTQLTRHIQRLNLLKRVSDSAITAAALSDLFIALGNKGFKLKKLMLAHLKSRLNEADYQLFQQHLESGLTEKQPLYLSGGVNGSVLSDGFEGNHHFLKEAESRSRSESDIDIARSFLEYGQVREAQDFLEEAFIHSPYNKELETELLTVYRFTQDTIGLNETARQLALKQETLSAEWKVVAEELADAA